MRVKFIDINTGEVRVGKYFDKDYTLNLTTLILKDGSRVVVGEWQLRDAR